MTQATSALPVATGHAAAGTDSSQAGRRSIAFLAKSLFALTKPRIIELLLVTTLPTMLLAQRGLPSVTLMAVTLVGGALAAGSANSDFARNAIDRLPACDESVPAAACPVATGSALVA